MGLRPVLRHDVSGHRFELRRLEHALLQRDTAVGAEPLRSQARSLVAGTLVAAVAVAGFAVYGFLRPRGDLGSEPVVMSRTSGALYVRVDDTLHPVVNLASARLIAGRAVTPRRVAESELRKTRRGATLGIPNAPAAIDEALPDASWAVCDVVEGDGRGTTVIVGAVDATRMRSIDGAAALLVTAGGDTHLLYDGRRARIDPTDPAVMRALHLEDARPQSLSSAMLNAIEESAPIAPPPIPDAGAPGPASLGALPIGTVIRVDRAAAIEHYVVLGAGLQRIGEVAADLIRFTDSGGDRDIQRTTPDFVSRARVVNILPLRDLPDQPPEVVTAAVLCARWHAGRVDFLAGASLPLAAGQTPVALGRADAAGPNLDAVFVPPGRSLHARAVSGGPTYLVTDTGARFGIGDPQAAADLGLPPPVDAPWAIIGLLPAGPELSRQRARLTVAGEPPAGRAMPPAPPHTR